jgi:1D-myo-inositol-tetrakisphosphate 5-kinase/inositol-polyphosphate multikinase
MYSASLLFVFEGDGATLRAAVDENRPSTITSRTGKGDEAGRSTARVDSGIVLDDDGELIPPGCVELDATADDLDEDEIEVSLPRIYSLKLIDFAHARWTPGQGPDENVLKGVRSLIRIFDELSR